MNLNTKWPLIGPQCQDCESGDQCHNGRQLMTTTGDNDNCSQAKSVLHFDSKVGPIFGFVWLEANVWLNRFIVRSLSVGQWVFTECWSHASTASLRYSILLNDSDANHCSGMRSNANSVAFGAAVDHMHYTWRRGRQSGRRSADCLRLSAPRRSSELNYLGFG